MPKCNNCNGKGAAKCPKCNGTGQVSHGWIDGKEAMWKLLWIGLSEMWCLSRQGLALIDCRSL
jgi:hypothetical protein